MARLSGSTVELYTDASRGNAGNIGIAFRLVLPTHTEFYACGQPTTIGDAEAEALVTALYYVKKNRSEINHLVWFSDSLSVVRLVTGKCKPRKPDMIYWMDLYKELSTGIKIEARFIRGHVPAKPQYSKVRNNFRFVDQLSRKHRKRVAS